MHIEKALEVTNRKCNVKQSDFAPHIGACKYFCVDKVDLIHSEEKIWKGEVKTDSFLHVLVVDGSGTLKCGEELKVTRGDSILLTAGSGSFEMQGAFEALLTTIPKE